MRKINEAVALFYSTTDDPRAEERKKVVERVCRSVGQARGVVIHLLYWKDNIAGGVAIGTGQSKVDEAVEGNFDIYFGCLGPLFGRGTVHEFQNALTGHIEKDSPVEVLFAFDETPINPFDIPENFQSVVEFRTSVHTSKKYGRAILYFTFSDLDQFYDRLFTNLDEAVRKFQSKIKGGPLPI